MNENYLRYFNAFGIKYNEKNNTFSFQGEQLEEMNYYDDINYMSIKEIHYVASISKDGTVFFRDGDKLSYIIYRSNPCELCYVTGDIKYYLSVYPDMLGNVTVEFTSGDESRKVDILIGESHSTPESYLDKLQDRIKDVHISKKDFLMVYAMYSDTRILERLTKLMNEMASDIEVAYNNKVNKLKAFYQDRMEELFNEQKSNINELTAYYNNFVREHGSTKLL